MIGALIAFSVIMALVWIMEPVWQEWWRHLRQRRAARRYMETPGAWSEHVPHRYLTPEIQRRLREPR